MIGQFLQITSSTNDPLMVFAIKKVKATEFIVYQYLEIDIYDFML